MKIILFGALAASAALLAGCRSTELTHPAPVETAQARVVESREIQTPDMLRVTGTLHAKESAMISAQVMGRVEQVLAHEGDNVRAGQTLAVLDDATLRAAAHQAQAGLMAAESQQAAAKTDSLLAASTLARYQQLQVQKSVTPQEMDEVSRRAESAAERLEALRAQGEAARAQDAGARAMLDYTRVRSPFAGVVTTRMADPGTMASPGVPLLEVDRDGPLQLQAAVDESAIGAVRKGMKVPVRIDSATAANALGSVVEIVPAADPMSHSFLIKIDLPSSRLLRAGMYGTAEIATGTRRAIFVPRSAVVLRGSLNCAYVLDSNGIAQLRYLTPGAAQGDRVEVLSGISPGEKLVDDPADRDLAGKHITEDHAEVQP